MPKDNVHFQGVEHRDIHNAYGMLQVRSLLFQETINPPYSKKMEIASLNL